MLHGSEITPKPCLSNYSRLHETTAAESQEQRTKTTTILLPSTTTTYYSLASMADFATLLARRSTFNSGNPEEDKAVAALILRTASTEGITAVICKAIDRGGANLNGGDNPGHMACVN